MPLDRLQSLLSRFSVSARMFHAGPLCGITDFEACGELGQLHLLRRGPVEIHHGDGDRQRIEQPSLVFYPRPLAHRFITDATSGADMACANIVLGGGPGSPIARALPASLVLPLSALPAARPLLEQLFDEAFAIRCGRQQVVDRLFEVVLILILRHLLDSRQVQQGPLAGLAHPALAKALVALHEDPRQAWSLERLAHCAGMSRSRFAEVFADTCGQTPMAYLASYRIGLAQDLLRRGHPLARVADEVGYGSQTSLSRAFSAHHGLSPRAWRRAQGG